VCHQTVSLTARHLESVGIPTVIVGSARDIVEEIGVPRFVFTDFPLGNPYGAPDDSTTQREVLDLALTTLEAAFAPRTTIQAPHVWEGDEAEPGAWRESFMFVSEENRDELLAEGERRRAKQAAKES